MFKKGAVENRVITFCYNAEDEDFSGQDSTKLSTWVFNEVEAFIQSAKIDRDLWEKVHNQGVVFFLHLLGTDVAGHSNKPHSSQYRENINTIDEGVRKIEKLFNEFYENDNKTAFIYTSDHGMTDWGSHGAGSDSETQVPLVAWGAGLASPKPLVVPHPSTPDHWGLSHLRRMDLDQADICPLMATLLGLPIPVHSQGVLYLDYLSLSDSEKAEALLVNADQLGAQFDCKRAQTEADMFKWFYRPFPHLTVHRQASMRHSITTLATQGHFKKAIEMTKDLIELTLEGLEYYHSYFQRLLLTCVSLTFLGWIAWLFCMLMHRSKENRMIYLSYQARKRTLHWVDFLALFSTFTVISLISIQSLPFQFNIYCCLPLILWWLVLRSSPPLSTFTQLPYLQMFGSALLYLILLTLLVLTFFERWILSLVIVALGCWPLLLGKRRSLVPGQVQACWIVTCLVLAVFPCLPVIGHQMHVEYVVGCGGLWILLGITSAFLLRVKGWILPYLLLVLASAMAIVFTTSHDFAAGDGVRSSSQLGSWISLVMGIYLPVLSHNSVVSRLFSIGFGLAVPFLLLSVGHEAFFLLALFLNLGVWITIEALLSNIKIMEATFEESPEKNQVLISDDFRRSFFFLTYIILSFFGTGNIASLNSFDVTWVQRFITSFSPFIITALILLKTLIPFMLVTCVFRAINSFSRVRAEKMLVIVLIYCDLMGLYFLFAVKNKGSWLEIGTSISHFVIMEVTVLFLAMLSSLARMYTGSVFVDDEYHKYYISPLWVPPPPTPRKTHPD